MSAETDRARVLLDNARAQLDREGQLLDVVGALTDQVRQLWHDLAELRDEHVALSNRIEATMRTRPTLGLYVRSKDTMREGEHCARCGVTVVAPAHSCHVSRQNYAVSA